ncbi:hypothetical protein BH11CYA1_BH11CYA1_37500 [soil metagenome]
MSNQETSEEKQYDWEERYKQPNSAPWDSGLPAPELEEYFASLINTDNIGEYPKHVLEIGCGTGTNAIWMAKHGCSVTTTEIAPTALEAAQKKATEAKATINFQLIDICESAPVAAATQDFAFDRGVYHIIELAKRGLFVGRVADALKTGSLWLSISGCKDEYRENPDVGPPQLSAIELLTPVESHFAVVKLERTYFVLDNGSKHLAWKALFQKR